MEISVLEAPAVIREQVNSRAWHVILSDQQATHEEVCLVLLPAVLTGALSWQRDVSACVFNYVSPEGVKSRVSYIAVRKTFPRKLLAELLGIGWEEAAKMLEDDSQDIITITDDQPGMIRLIENIASGGVRAHRGAGVN